jgi:hypothetical protein
MGGLAVVRKLDNLTYWERRSLMADQETSSFTQEDRKALTGLIVEVRLRFDSLDRRLEKFDLRLTRVEENAVMRGECNRIEHERDFRLDRVEQFKIDAETVRALELRVVAIEKDRGSLASISDVTRAEAAVGEARAAVEQAKTDVQSIKNRLAYMAGGLAAAIAIIEFAFKYLLK